MTTNKVSVMKGKGVSVLKRILSVFVFFLALPAFSAENDKWVIAAQKFSFAKGQETNSVKDSTAQMLPAMILENIGQNSVRNVAPDERLDRFKYDSKKERLSLFLQLSSAYKTRNNLVLYDYSDFKLEQKIEEAQKNIEKIQTQIDENLEELAQEEKKSEKLEKQEEKAVKDEQKSDSELYKFSNLFKNLVVSDESVFTSENVTYYSNDYNALFNPSARAQKEGPLSSVFEKECMNAGINTLLTGTITSYGDYLSVCVELYLYPQAKKLCSVVEVGSLKDLDFMAHNIAQSLLPVITNAMPVKLLFEITPQEAAQNVQIYIDDQLQNVSNGLITVDSGVHSLQFTSAGYDGVSTSYYFEGNKNFSVQVQMEPLQTGAMLIGIERTGFDTFFQSLPLTANYNDSGAIYYNGVRTQNDEEGRSKIVINGNKILGQFVSDDGTTDFFYVPPKYMYDSNNIAITPQQRDRSKYIDTRRKWMYGSYSLLIVSLIPTIYCYGTYENMAKRWNSLRTEGVLTNEDLTQAQKMQNWVKITSGISVGCGVFFGFELVRYLNAANSVLPKKAKKAKKEIVPVSPPPSSPLVEPVETSTDGESDVIEASKLEQVTTGSTNGENNNDEQKE